jgi:hypothetical protein
MASEYNFGDGIDNSKLYSLVLNCKLETEKNRDEVNKYYISLFAALISLIPILDKFGPSVNFIDKYSMRYALPLISSIGVMLSISWWLNLKRIHNYLQGVDELLIEMEKQSKISFISYMINYLNKTHSPARVTKQQIIIPYGFFFIFSVIFVYSLFSSFFV